MNTIRVADIMAVMEQLAPSVLAEDWDNCGLQVGSARWPVQKIWVALDPLSAVVQTAVHQKVDLVITHHPLLIRPLRVIDVDTPAGKIIETALAAKLAIYSAHTNLDCAREGVNEVLARAIGLKDLVPMIPSKVEGQAKTADPYMGMGRLGRLDADVSLEALALRVKADLKLGAIKVAGAPGMIVNQVAVCSGSGSSLLDAFLQSPAQVFISGDLRYHDARRVEDAGRALIDVGHFSSEHLVIGPLVDQLNAVAQSKRWQVSIEPCRLEVDPFYYLTNGKI